MEKVNFVTAVTAVTAIPIQPPYRELSENNGYRGYTSYKIQDLRGKYLEAHKNKQNFRVSIGKSKWINYVNFDPNYNLREVLRDEIVIEFDSEDINIVVPAINFTGINLYNAGLKFEWWDHGGRSPHLHIRDLPITHLEKKELKLFKETFIKHYVPVEYHKWADLSLCGIHLVALEYSPHWKGKYGVKKLISVFDGQNKDSWGVTQ